MPSLMELLGQESAPKRLNLTARPIPAGNPVMEQMGGGGGFQITPEELAFEPKASRGKAFGTAALSTLFGGAKQAIPAYQASMGQQENRQIEEAYRGASQRFLEKENRTRQDFNELAQFRAQLTGEQPRLYAPPNIQTTLRERPYTKDGVGYFQREFVGIDPDTGQMVGEAQPYGDPIRQQPGKRRAPLTRQQVSDYRNTLDVRDRVASGGWEQQVLDVIRAIDPEGDVDLENEGAAMALLYGAAPSARLHQYVIDDVTKLAKAYDSVPGDPESQEPGRKRKQREHKKRVIDIWRKHKFGETAEEAAESSAARAAAEVAAKAEAERRLSALGASPSAGTTAAEPTQGRSFLDRAREIAAYAGQQASIGPPTNVLRSEQAPERLQPITTPRVSGAPFEGGEQAVEGARQVGSTLEELAEQSRSTVEEHQARRRAGSLERYRRQVKKFKRGDREPRKLSALERSLAEIVNGESAVR